MASAVLTRIASRLSKKALLTGSGILGNWCHRVSSNGVRCCRSCVVDGQSCFHSYLNQFHTSSGLHTKYTLGRRHVAGARCIS